MSALSLGEIRIGMNINEVKENLARLGIDCYEEKTKDDFSLCSTDLKPPFGLTGGDVRFKFAGAESKTPLLSGIYIHNNHIYDYLNQKKHVSLFNKMEPGDKAFLGNLEVAGEHGSSDHIRIFADKYISYYSRIFNTEPKRVKWGLVSSECRITEDYEVEQKVDGKYFGKVVDVMKTAWAEFPASYPSFAAYWFSAEKDIAALITIKDKYNPEIPADAEPDWYNDDAIPFSHRDVDMEEEAKENHVYIELTLYGGASAVGIPTIFERIVAPPIELLDETDL